MTANPFPRASAVLGALSVTLLFALALWSVAVSQPTPPRGLEALATEFSAARALPVLHEIAQRPHALGTQENARVRDYLMAQLRRLGFEPQLQSALGIYNNPTQPMITAAPVHNILLRIPGTAADRASRKALLLMAHYDSVPSGPGAADDGASVAAILETLRALQQGEPLQNDLLVVITDGEELGLLGAEAFVAQHPWVDDVGMALNFEFRGNRGAMTMFETSPGNAVMIAGMAQAVAHPVANSLNYEVYRFLSNDTDMSALKRGGIRGLNFAAIEGHTSYHTVLDRPELLDPASLQHQGEIMLSLVRHFGQQNLSELGASDRVYFDFPGLGLVHYPASAVWPLTLFSLGLFLLVCTLGLRRNQLRASRLFAGTLAVTLVLALLALLAQGAWRAIVSLHPAYQLMPQGMSYNGHWYLLAFVALGVAAFFLLLHGLRRWITPAEMTLGSALIWLLLLAAASAFVPGASFLLTWPLWPMLLAQAGCLIWPHMSAGRRLCLLLLGAAPAVLLFAPLIRGAFIALGPNMLFVTVLALGLLCGLLSGLAQFVSARLALLVGALGLGLVVQASLSAGFDVDHPQRTNLFYAKDMHSGQAYWLSASPTTDRWNEQLFNGVSQQSVLPELFGPTAAPLWVSPAADVAVPAPQLRVLADRTSGKQRTLTLQLLSQRVDGTFVVAVEGAKVLGSQLNGEPLQRDTRDAWMLRFSGMGTAATQLELLLESGKAFNVRVIERTYGLPEALLPARPEDVIPQPGGMSETTLTVSLLAFVP